jgi:hypothetical protein
MSTTTTKSEFGQFFTKDSLVNFVFDRVTPHVQNVKDILEPSFGEGSFLIKSLKLFPKSNIDAYEIDPDIYRPIKGVKSYLGDFLFSNIEKKYDLIIGNPPYIELVYSFYDKEKQKEFKNVFHKTGRGRINLVHAFFDRSFDLLNENGIIAYLLPSTILSSPWYLDIRKHIYDNFTICDVVEDVKFEGVSIQVSLLIIKKNQSETKKFFLNDQTFQISHISCDDSGISLKDLGFEVGVGQYCWSHYKDKVTDNENVGKKIIYSSYIDRNSLNYKEIKNPEKKKNLVLDEYKIVSNAILLPRTVSKKIRMAKILDNIDKVLENHVIYVSHQDRNQIEKLYDYFQNNEDKISILLNSTNLTKNEIENIKVMI